MRALVLGLVATLAMGTGGYFLLSGGEDEASAGGRTARHAIRGDRLESDGDEGGARGERGARPSGELERLEARVDRLERELRQLKAQMRARGEAGEPRLDDPSATAVIHEVVEDAVEDVRQREREQRLQRRNERMTQFREEALERFAEAASLSPATRDKVGELWAAEQEAIGPLVQKARDGEMDWRELREQIEAMRARTDQAATELLDEEQRAAYDEHRPGPRGGGPRGGRGGPPGPPGGPPPG